MHGLESCHTTLPSSAHPSRSCAENGTAIAPTTMRRDIKISRATHLMHLEVSRYALYREAETFLNDRDHSPAST